MGDAPGLHLLGCFGTMCVFCVYVYYFGSATYLINYKLSKLYNKNNEPF